MKHQEIHTFTQITLHYHVIPWFISVEEKGISFGIEDVIMHPDYEGQSYQDVAVVKLMSSEGKLFKANALDAALL